MSKVAAWLVAQATRLERVPSLEDALLGARPLRYVVYRLRYVYMRAVLRTAFRIVELGLFASYLPFEVLGPVLVLRSAMLLADGLYWGALETLRHDVRTLASSAQLPRAVRTIRAWLAVACVLGIGALALAALWVWLKPWLGGTAADFISAKWLGLDVVDAFVLACALRWGLDTLSRTYHSGVYGVRRVYRPTWSLLLFDGADIVVFAGLFFWLGAWGAAVAVLIVGLLRAWLGWRFTSRVYAALKLFVGAPRFWFRSLGGLGAGARREQQPRRPLATLKLSVMAALGNGVAQVDALLILGLLAAPDSERGTLLLAALFHVLAPLLSAAQAWTRLFYFDFKRLEAWRSAFLLARFEALLARVAWLAVLPVGLFTFCLMGAFWRGPSLLLAFELSCLSCVRSWLALRHMRAYSLSDHRFLRKLFFGMLLVCASTQVIATLPAEHALGALVVLATLGLLLLGRSERSLAPEHGRSLLGPSAWLHQLLAQAGTTAIGLARVDRRLTSVGRLARTLSRQLPAATLGRLGNDTLIWFTPYPPKRATLLAAACGSLKELCMLDGAPDGCTAMRRGLPSPAWERTFTSISKAMLQPGGKLESEQLLNALQLDLSALRADLKLVPLQGSFEAALFTSGSSRALRHLILDAARGHTAFQRIGEQEVLALAPAGTPVALLVTQKSSQPQAEWKPAVMALVQRTELLLTLVAASGAIARMSRPTTA